jgi:hypothetical protein
MSHRLVTLILKRGLNLVSKDIDNIQRAVIKALHKDGQGKRQQQRADRYEAFFKDSNSGCYHNGELLPSADQLRSGDPLSELLLEEEITNRLIEGARHGLTS